jgi:hypothetical protein
VSYTEEVIAKSGDPELQKHLEQVQYAQQQAQRVQEKSALVSATLAIGGAAAAAGTALFPAFGAALGPAGLPLIFLGGTTGGLYANMRAQSRTKELMQSAAPSSDKVNTYVNKAMLAETVDAELNRRAQADAVNRAQGRKRVNETLQFPQDAIVRRQTDVVNPEGRQSTLPTGGVAA